MQDPAPQGFPPGLEQSVGTPPWVAPFLALLIMTIVGAVLVFPLIRAWARRIEGRTGDPQMAEELGHLRERVAELELSGAHVAELEERLDFAERLLAQRHDVPKLPQHRTPV